MKAASYILTGVKFEGTGQAKLVYDILAESGPLDVKTVAARLNADPAFRTRQTAERIAAYYVCVFKKAGIAVPVSSVTTPENAFAGMCGDE